MKRYLFVALVSVFVLFTTGCDNAFKANVSDFAVAVVAEEIAQFNYQDLNTKIPSVNALSPEQSDLYVLVACNPKTFLIGNIETHFVSPDGEVMVKKGTCDKATFKASVGARSWERKPGTWLITVSYRLGNSTVPIVDKKVNVVSVQIHPVLQQAYGDRLLEHARTFAEALQNNQEHVILAADAPFVKETPEGIYYGVHALYGTQYNSLQVDRYARAGKSFELFLSAIRQAGGLPPEALAGYYLISFIPFSDFVRKTSVQTDVVEITIPRDKLEQHLRNEITSQQLVNGSMILINKEKVEISLQR